MRAVVNGRHVRKAVFTDRQWVMVSIQDANPNGSIRDGLACPLANANLGNGSGFNAEKQRRTPSVAANDAS
jgi:hypothetical protein